MGNQESQGQEIMGSTSSLFNHLKKVKELHRQLDEKITRHWKHHVNDDTVRQEKYEKLALKRKIEELKTKLEEMEENETYQ